MTCPITLGIIICPSSSCRMPYVMATFTARGPLITAAKIMAGPALMNGPMMGIHSAIPANTANTRG